MASKPPKFEGAPMWIVTFADLSTLMLTFFVLLLSFSNQDIIKFREMLGSVQGAFGVEIRREGEFKGTLTGEGTETEKEEKEKQEKAKLKRQLVQVTNQIKKAAKEANMSDNTEITSTPDGVLVRVKGEALFNSGATRINSSAVKLLKELASILKSTGFFLTVEGHTDNVPLRPGANSLYKSNWELSGVRAAVVVRYLRTRMVDKSQLAAAGYADMRPVASNDTAEGRARNRRVEFLIKKP